MDKKKRSQSQPRQQTNTNNNSNPDVAGVESQPADNSPEQNNKLPSYNDAQNFPKPTPIMNRPNSQTQTLPSYASYINIKALSEIDAK